MTRTWYLVRHGQTEWNAVSRMQGQLDSPLTPLGREHARTSARVLAQLGVDRLFASPLGRVRNTVAIMNESLCVPVTFDARLKEWSAGLWSGELYAEIRHKWPAEWTAWEADRYTCRSPGGENFLDLAARARAFLTDTPVAPGTQVAIVAHGFMNRALASVLLPLMPAEALNIRQFNDTVIRVVECGGATAVDHFVNGQGPVPGLPSDPAHLGDPA